MIVVANAGPLIALAQIGHFNLTGEVSVTLQADASALDPGLLLDPGRFSVFLGNLFPCAFPSACVSRRIVSQSPAYRLRKR